MGDCLYIGKPGDGDLAGTQPIARRLLGQPRLSEMIGQGLGLGLDDAREGLLDGMGDGGVKLSATAPEQPG
jgi:hypothetical protein